MWFSMKRRQAFSTKTIEYLKEHTRILFIDDEPDLVIASAVEKEGWHVRKISDLEIVNDTNLKDSHIVCFDINGIGKKLGVKDGMGLVKIVKREYPWKKIILYSSKSQQNTFDDAVGMADKRLPKDGQIYPFLMAIEELSRDLFEWNSMIVSVYKMLKHDLPNDISIDEFQSKMKKIVFKRKADIDFIVKILSTSQTAAKIILFVVGLFA